MNNWPTLKDGIMAFCLLLLCLSYLIWSSFGVKRAKCAIQAICVWGALNLARYHAMGGGHWRNWSGAAQCQQKIEQGAALSSMDVSGSDQTCLEDEWHGVTWCCWRNWSGSTKKKEWMREVAASPLMDITGSDEMCLEDGWNNVVWCCWRNWSGSAKKDQANKGCLMVNGWCWKWWDMFRTHMAWLSGFKPSSTLSDPGRGQPTSLGPLGWSIMSLDGLVHPQKIIQVYLTCPHSH